MNYIEFRSRMAPLTIFSLHDARMIESDFDRRRLYEWRQKGYIKLLVKGWYLFTDVVIDETTLDLIANRMYAPSYVSMETVLSRKGFIPETVHSLLSITTRKTRDIQTGIALFVYRTVSPDLFFGYDIAPRGVKVASAEKAVLDYLYLHADLVAPEDFENLRLERRELSSGIDAAKFNEFLLRFGSKALTFRAERFMKWLRYA
jgi:predicted transcriptional regulator of viral defense system